MEGISCRSCHRIFQLRLRSHLKQLQHLRRGYHLSPVLYEITNPSQELSKLPRTHSLYSDSFPPTSSELAASSLFFNDHQPAKTWTGNEWRKQKPTTSASTFSSSQHSNSVPMLTPEIVFLGRSNVGKSSLLNALLGSQDLCRVGPKPGKTQTMHSWTLAPLNTRTGTRSNMERDSKLTVLDMPGYGHGSRDEWGQEIVKYLRNRRELRRAFVLLNPKHGVKDQDWQILELLKRLGISHQIIATKVETMKKSEVMQCMIKLRDTVKEQNKSNPAASTIMLDDILAVGKLGDGKLNKKVKLDGAVGIDEVRWAVLRACGLESYAMDLYAEKLKRSGKMSPATTLPASGSLTSTKVLDQNPQTAPIKQQALI